MLDGWELTIASDGLALDLLIQEFPDANFVHLAPLDIHYGNKFTMPFLLYKQIEKWKEANRQDEAILQEYFRNNRVDLVISDGRIGLVHPFIKCILINHQLHPAPFWINRFIGKRLKECFARFNEIWVPDYEDAKLSGRLSDASGLLNPVKFIGPKSRYAGAGLAHSGYVLAVISGPNPSRKIFAEKLIKELKKSGLTYKVIYGGLDLEGEHVVQMPDNEFIQKEWQKAEVVIARSGYSTIMDLELSKKKAVLIPTPGQYEQLYLAKHLKGNNANLMFCKESSITRLGKMLRQLI